jgi:hypothetical protein
MEQTNMTNQLQNEFLDIVNRMKENGIPLPADFQLYFLPICTTDNLGFEQFFIKTFLTENEANNFKSSLREELFEKYKVFDISTYTKDEENEQILDWEEYIKTEDFKARIAINKFCNELYTSYDTNPFGINQSFITPPPPLLPTKPEEFKIGDRNCENEELEQKQQLQSALGFPLGQTKHETYFYKYD